MKKLVLVLLAILVSGCGGVPLTQKDRDEFDKWEQQRDWERYDYRPERPKRKSSIELLELSSNPFLVSSDEWKGDRVKPQPEKKYYKPYPRRRYRRHYRRDRCDGCESRGC